MPLIEEPLDPADARAAQARDEYRRELAYARNYHPGPGERRIFADVDDGPLPSWLSFAEDRDELR